MASVGGGQRALRNAGMLQPVPAAEPRPLSQPGADVGRHGGAVEVAGGGGRHRLPTGLYNVVQVLPQAATPAPADDPCVDAAGEAGRHRLPTGLYNVVQAHPDRPSARVGRHRGAVEVAGGGGRHRLPTDPYDIAQAGP